MPVKFHCPRCGRRYVEWGAEKLGFKCPDCENEDLVRVGSADDRPAKKPALKRAPKKKEAEARSPVDGDEALVPDVAGITEDTDTSDDEDAVEETETTYTRSASDLLLDTSDDSDEVDIDVSEGLPFGEVSPGLGEESLGEDDVEGDWKD